MIPPAASAAASAPTEHVGAAVDLTTAEKALSSGFPFPNPADFSWTAWDVHASVGIGTLLVCLFFVWLARTARTQFRLSEKPLEGWRWASFWVAIVVLMAVLNGPLHELSDFFLFSAHMVQHLALTQVFPPLLLLAVPGWMLMPALRIPAVAAVGRFLSRPLWAFLISSGVLIFWHVPWAYEWSMRNHDVHILEHVMFIVSAVIMWFPVFNPVSAIIPRPGAMFLMIYLFLTTLPMALLGIIITMAQDVLYPFYAEAPRIFPALSAHQDQVLGGLIMWVPGAMLPWVAMAVLFFQWFESDQDGVTQL